jgi:hypothetical protein
VATDHELRYLAAIICLYSLSEFLVKRFLWRHVPKILVSTVFIQTGLLLTILGIGTLGFSSWKLLAGFLLVAAQRTFWDIWLGRRVTRRFLETFIFTQAFTILLLTAVWRFVLPVHVHDWYVRLETLALGSLGNVGSYLQESTVVVFVTLAAYFFMVDGGARIVRGILGKFPILMETVSGTAAVNKENRGEWIGVLERIITLTFVLTGSYTAVAFALTAKSIARFKELDSKDFAEYYLLGTSASVATALLVGALVQILVKNL